MRNIFDKQLENLHIELIKMGSLCEEAISGSLQALNDKSEDIIKSIFMLESEIDQKERDIEGLCMRLILQQQPVASDLRVVSAAMKMISDMERIGDQAEDIAEIIKFIQNDPIKKFAHIDEMGKAASKMVTNSIDSFIKRDLTLAGKVIASDDIIDGLFIDIKKELINYIQEKPESGEYCLDLLMIAKYFERIGDHAANIAEWVEFSITGIYKGEAL
ncbi:phosphate signaling complex protein PhoU [Porcipelethomonas sp.]|uniref:phosphate signaling complex protein PhoU n=1 Tax=Porcipelethomonas sp. TaxID=2981675 RepID=UPI003EF735EA